MKHLKDRSIISRLAAVSAVGLLFVCMLWVIVRGANTQQTALNAQLKSERKESLFRAREIALTEVRRMRSGLGRKPDENLDSYLRRLQDTGCSGCILWDPDAQLVFPHDRTVDTTVSFPAEWYAAKRLEAADSSAEASELYAGVAMTARKPSVRAEAIRAQIRCLIVAREAGLARDLIKDEMTSRKIRSIRGVSGNLIEPDLLLLLLRRKGWSTGQDRLQYVVRLKKIIEDRGNRMSSRQRVFLAGQLQAIDDSVSFPLIEFETLSLQASSSAAARPDGVLRFSPTNDRWEMTTDDRLTVLLFAPDYLQKLMNEIVKRVEVTDGTIAFLPPGAPESGELSIAAGNPLRDWQIVYSPRPGMEINRIMSRSMIKYALTGAIAMALIIGFGTIVYLCLRKRLILAALRNDLLANVSHELKTPLASTRAMVDTLLDMESLNPTKTREYLEIIGRENQRLSRLVENFLTFSRLESGKYRTNVGVVAANEVLLAVETMSASRIKRDSCQFIVRDESEGAMARMDKELIVTALLNLVENAYKYSKEDKWIELSATVAGEVLRFQVADHGVGLTTQQQAKIFERYYRVDQGLTQVSGCGIGLSLVDLVARAHGAQPGVTSEPGVGSQFYLELVMEEI